jgi:hypothetical protein
VYLLPIPSPEYYPQGYQPPYIAPPIFYSPPNGPRKKKKNPGTSYYSKYAWYTTSYTATTASTAKYTSTTTATTATATNPAKYPSSEYRVDLKPGANAAKLFTAVIYECS